jgi:hypothetical protein
MRKSLRTKSAALVPLPEAAPAASAPDMAIVYVPSCDGNEGRRRVVQRRWAATVIAGGCR